jgi:hypothetical protein
MQHSQAAQQVVERVHRPERAAYGFRHHPLRHAARAGVPGFRRRGGNGRLAAAGPGKIHRQSGRARSPLNELYASLQRRIGIFTALPFASLDRMALKTRLDELAGGSLPVAAMESR